MCTDHPGPGPGRQDLALADPGALEPAADRERRVPLPAWVPGRTVEGSGAARDPEVYRQAGVLLARLHAVGSRVDGDWEAAQDARALAWLDGAHGIAVPVVARLRAVIASHHHPPVRVVPAHGDFRPRNWMVDDDGAVRLVGFGRFGWRPPVTDVARLRVRLPADGGNLAAAFVDGYGADLRAGASWHRALLREAIGTAVRAHRVGDAASEAQGQRMIGVALDGAGT